MTYVTLPRDDEALNAHIAKLRAAYEAELDIPGSSGRKSCADAYMALFRAITWRDSSARKMAQTFAHVVANSPNKLVVVDDLDRSINASAAWDEMAACAGRMDGSFEAAKARFDEVVATDRRIAA